MGIGATYLHLANDGQVLAGSGFPGPDQPALRRAQAVATTNGVGRAIAQSLLTRKIAGQRDVLAEQFATQTRAREVVERALDRFPDAIDVRGALALEAQAAVAYWACWPSTRVIREGR